MSARACLVNRVAPHTYCYVDATSACGSQDEVVFPNLAEATERAGYPHLKRCTEDRTMTEDNVQYAIAVSDLTVLAQQLKIAQPGQDQYRVVSGPASRRRQ
ncbi:hypothetical protein DL771_004346 [Monosporascus sp. 5C6A]|nr:hypothetical protein DL771_004346 [Monosporascus sp. 5C6A]